MLPMTTDDILAKYNVVIYDYGGEHQYRFYEKPIIKGKKKKNNNKSKLEMTKEEQLKNITLSNSGTIEHFENILKLIDKDKERSTINSANRAKNKIYEYARANEWHYFITLTFNPQKIDSTDYTLVVNKMSQWIKNIKRNHAPNLKYIIVPELHADGKKWHFHCLWSNVGDIKFINSGKKDKGRIIYNLGNYKLGWTTATKIRDSKKASNYISKYITKTLCNEIKGKKKYWVSLNLKKPVITKLNLSEDEKKVLLTSLARHITHSSVVNVDLPDYKQKINYYEIIIPQEVES